VSKKPHGASASNPGWFPKGRSGNPEGRPRGSRVTTGSVFEVSVDKTLTVPDRGGTREITVEDGLQRRTYQDALAGSGDMSRRINRGAFRSCFASQASRFNPFHDLAHGLGLPMPH
jgi:Family of unknown function (DUF5681)